MIVRSPRNAANLTCACIFLIAGSNPAISEPAHSPRGFRVPASVEEFREARQTVLRARSRQALVSRRNVLSADVRGHTAQAHAATQNDLDAFMEKVLARREVNRKTLQEYVLDEVETFGIFGPGRSPLHRSKREFTWYVRDGIHVRSPVRFNGVSIGEAARQRYEREWLRRERERQERKAKKERETREVTVSPGGIHIGDTVVPTEPRFVSEAYFMDFKFEPGNYYLAGREQLEGHEVLRIEYYPTRLFGDDEEDERRKGDAGKDRPRSAREDRAGKQARAAEQDIERRMNKTALVTLWVDPAEHQIVKYTFDNVWLDFLPGAWLVRVDELRASMVMGQPFPGVWLPRDIAIRAGLTLANGSFEAEYGRAFSQYRLAEVETKIRIPKQSSRLRGSGFSVQGAAFALEGSRFEVQRSPSRTRRFSVAERLPDWLKLRPMAIPSGAGDQTPPQDAEVIGEIRVHGNAFLTDAEVLQLGGVAVGQPLAADGVDTITRRLKDSGRFETVDVRKRYRSLTSTTDVALVLVVHERPGVRSEAASAPGLPKPIARPVGRFRSKLMFLPIVSYADGYGFTYGGRMSTVDLLGADERLSVPLTWGGTRRAALEFERLFKAGPLTRIGSSFGISNRENPRFDIRDQRVEWNGRAERVFADLLRTTLEASRSTISFGALDDRLWTLGTSVTLDTRLDPAFPANALMVGAGWSGLHFRELPDPVNRLTADLRGYIRLFRQIVAAARVQYTGADAALPPYERLLLGGASSLRGFRTGAFDADRTLLTSIELRAPITSVLSGAKFGVTVFLDEAKGWNHGQSMNEVSWHRGAGGGVFLIASVVKINLDVARGLKTGDTRVHLSSGFAF